MMAIESQTTLKQAGFRVELDRGASPMENRRHECLGKMIRTAESKKMSRVRSGENRQRMSHKCQLSTELTIYRLTKCT